MVIADELGINHQSPLIHFFRAGTFSFVAGNQSPIPFDTLRDWEDGLSVGWESITNPL